MAQVLVIEDEPLLARNICESLSLAGHDAMHAATGENGVALAAEHAPDVVLLDLRLPGIDGMDVYRELRERQSTAAVVVMTAYGNVQSAVEAMKSGVSDYLTKPLDLQELDLTIDRVLQARQLHANLDYFRRREQAESSLRDIIGESAAMQKVTAFIERICATPALASDVPPSVLLTGETGTGKDLIARAIHYAGPRHDRPFVHVNCTALPEQLVEAELFGHVRGAFTDARGDKRGLFEVADRGTIFLDEIGHMDVGMQSKLLGTLEHRTIRPVGGTREKHVDVHVVAATNRNLSEAIESGAFRSDLFHRLRVLSIDLPPLNQRGDDVILLAEHFLQLYAGRFQVGLAGFTADALQRLRDHDWPGNVRELSHVIESAVLIADGPRVREEHLNMLPTPEQGNGRATGEGMRMELPAGEVLSLDFSDGCPKLEDVEYRVISAAVEHARHNISRAARTLGISRDAVRYRLEKYRKEHGIES